MANWKKVLVSGSAIEVRNITASGLPESSGGGDKIVVIDTNTGRLAYTSSAAGGGGIFVNQSTYYDTENSIKITGSTLQAGSPGGANGDYVSTSSYASSFGSSNYAFMVSQSAYFDNHNVGHPNSLPWQSNLGGSIFNSYNASTDVSEILRTLVGIISSSHPSSVASPTASATKYNGYRAETEGLTSTTSTFDRYYLPENFTNTNAIYLNSQGFNDGAGDHLLGNVGDVRSTENGNYGIQVDLRGGSTYGGDFDAGGNTTPFTVFADISQSFGDAQSFASTLSTTTNTFTTQSSFKYSVNVGETSNGIVVTQLDTDNPTVIPPQFKKATGNDTPLQPSRVNGGIAFTNISSSGYYRYEGVLLGVSTASAATRGNTIGGMQNPVTQTGVETRYFFTPLQATDFTEAAATISNNTVTATAAASRSLSGAPYLNSATFTTSVTASGIFNPFYRSNATLALTDATNGGGFSVSGDGSTAGVNSSGKINTDNVFKDNTEQASNGTVIPDINSTVRFEETLTWFGSDNEGETNIQQSGLGTTNFTYKITTKGFKGTDTDNTDTTKNFHTQGTFGQPAASGSMAVFKSSDGGDTSDLDGPENFKGETYRRSIGASDTVSNLSNAFDSGSRLSNSAPRDAQVKPGFLVIPGSTYGYWYPTSYYAVGNYYFYLREFDLTFSGEQGTLNIELNNDNSTTLTQWTTGGADTLSVCAILESGVGTGAGSRTNLVDLSKPPGATSDVAQGDNNPFTNAVNIQSYGGSYTSGTASITLDGGLQQTMNNTFSKVWVLVRQRGSTTSNLITKIDLSVS